MAVFWPDDYLSRVARQIRVRRVREPLIAELRDHMLLQKAEYVEQGLSEAEAERRTCEDMGDALLVGGELDAAHRPKPQWRGLMIALLLMAIGLGVQLINGTMAGAFAMDTLGGTRAFFTMLAVAPLCLFAFADYTFWIRWSLPVFLAWGLIAFYRLWLCIGFNPEIPLYRGFGFMLASPALAVLVPQVLAVAVPLMVALLACRLRGRGWGVLALSLSPALALMLLCWDYRDSGYDVAPCALMAVVGLVTLFLAIKERFFHVNHTAAYAVLASLIIPAFAFALSRFNLQPPDSEIRQLIGTILRGARPIGPAATLSEASGAWRRFVAMGYGVTDYMLPALVARWGWLPCAGLLLGGFGLLARCLRRFAVMENRMGALLGIAAASTLALQAMLYLPAAFALTGEHLCLPLLSYGHGMLMADAALAGVMLGVLRGEDLPEAEVFPRPIPIC